MKEQIEKLDVIWQALNTLQLVGYTNCGTYYHCLQALEQVMQELKKIDYDNQKPIPAEVIDEE